MAAPSLTQPSKSLSIGLGSLLPSIVLALIMCGAVIYSLAISNWAPGLDVLLPMSLPGFLVGVIFARIRWMPAWVAHSFCILLAIVWGVQLLGAQMNPAISTWLDRGSELLIRTIIWARVLSRGGRGEDLLLFVAVLCLLAWALVYDSAWQLFRHGRSWRTITANALVFLVNYTYVLPKPNLPFFCFLGAALLLLAHQHIVQRQAQWDTQQIEYPDLLPLRFLWSAALVCTLLVAVTAVLPGSISVDRATRTWEAISQPFKQARTGWEDAFSTLNAPPGAGSGSFAAHSAQLGGARRLNNNLVLTVQSSTYEYWRAVAFDKYSDGRWHNTTGEHARAAIGASTPEQARTLLQAGEPLSLSHTAGHQVITQTFTLAQDRGDRMVFVGGSPLAFSIPTLVEHNYRQGSGQPEPNFDDTALIIARDGLRAGSTYTVTALLSQADVQSLRAAGTSYPDWVIERYLQLPDSISARTRARAAQIVAEAKASTPYDQVIAIQSYLRTLRYTESIPTSPAGVDPVDWFLFTQREGYCDYFASSMVVMLRSLGVPARWVQGYAGGTFNAELGIYEVRESLAHSWPEVYFPGIGWERFEPTPASYAAAPVRPISAIVNPNLATGTPGPTSLPTPSRNEDLEDGMDQVPHAPQPLPSPPPPPRELGPLPKIIGGLLGTLALLALLIYARWRYELRGLSQVSAAYAAMGLLASWGGHGQAPNSTPLEYASRIAADLPAHREVILQIASAYQAERYHRRPEPLPTPEQQRALHIDLARRIFTGIAERLPQPRPRT